MFDQLGAVMTGLLLAIIAPFRLAMEFVGLAPTDMQVWALVVALFMFGIILPQTIGDIVLMRRRVAATGRVVKIDTSSDGPDTPTIAFVADGREWTFASNLPCTDQTNSVGADVPVIYDPLNPKRAREEGRTLSKIWFAVLWYVMAGWVFAYALFGLPGGGA
jgi:hypothetical protein